MVTDDFDAADSIGDFDQLLRIYYRRLFPYKKFVRWLSYGNGLSGLYIQWRHLDNHFTVSKDYLARREFSFTIKDRDGQDIYLRYQSFGDKAELKKEINRIFPIKIDIGAVFSAKVSRTVPCLRCDNLIS